jgi:hypothetical protein
MEPVGEAGDEPTDLHTGHIRALESRTRWQEKPRARAVVGLRTERPSARALRFVGSLSVAGVSP